MQKKENDFVPRMDFQAQTPEVNIKQKKIDLLYEKAFLSHEPDTENEYQRNTTTWD